MTLLPTHSEWAQYSFRAMGARISMWLDADPATASRAFAEGEALFRDVERALSRFDSTSELSCLNDQAGSWVSVSKTLWAVLQEALDFAEKTDGLFDPTVLNALMSAGHNHSFSTIGRGGQADTLPASQPTGHWQDIRYDSQKRRVWLPPGLGLDFGGIAKGYTAQWTAQLLDLWGPSLVDAGGDIVAGDAPSGLDGWPVAIASPRTDENESTTSVADLSLANGALATSGIDHRQWMANGKPAHHIIDPRSGAPAITDALTVSVLAPSGTEAEVWAKVALIIGIDDGFVALNERCIPVLIIDQQHKLYINEYMKNQLKRSKSSAGLVDLTTTLLAHPIVR